MTGAQTNNWPLQRSSDFSPQPATAPIVREPVPESSVKCEGMASLISTNGRDRLRDVPFEIPSRGILAIKVVLGSRSCAAPPFGPPITQLVSRSGALIWARLASASVLMGAGAAAAKT
jgi:hypothetical protein